MALCRVCRVHLRRDFPYCLHCGTARSDAQLQQFAPPQLTPLTGAVRPIPLARPVTTIGRHRDNDVVVDHHTVSRWHARIVRTPAAYVVENLGSRNGIRIAGREPVHEHAELHDGAVVAFGEVPYRFDHPRTADIGSRTVHGARQTVLQQPRSADAADTPVAAEASEPLSTRPRKRSGWALKQVPSGGWVLSSRTGRYLELDERDVFLFDAIDGEATVRDLLFAYAERFGELALPRIEATLQLFARSGLVGGVTGEPVQRHGLRRAGHAVYRSLMGLQLSVSGLDRFIGRFYEKVGWRAFTRTGVVLVWLVIGLGGYAFVDAFGRERLLDAGGAGLWWPFVVAGCYLSALLIHETCHALAVKSYGRRVRRGGFLLMMGLPFAFVDTSDMWFGSRWSRVVVAMAGPISTATLAGLAAVGADWLPGTVAPALCFQLAYGLYLNTAYNFNPIMPLDGYQALTDAFRVPRLRQEAAAYFARGMWRDLRAGRRPRLREFGLALYGFAVVVGTALLVALAVTAWRTRLGPLVHRYVPSPWDVVLVVGVVGLVTFPIWVRLVSRARRWVRGSRPSRRGR